MDKNNVHLMTVQKNNISESEVLRRHLENLCATYGPRFTTEVILRVLDAEIKEIKQSKKAQKVG